MLSYESEPVAVTHPPLSSINRDMFTVRLDGSVLLDHDQFRSQRGDLYGDDALDRHEGRKTVFRSLRHERLRCGTMLPTAPVEATIAAHVSIKVAPQV